MKMPLITTAELRARFALKLAELYGAEVPAYNTLVDVSLEVNRDVLANRRDAQRLGDIERVTAERHGAIRVGSPRELAQAAHIFAAFGMHPVGFYDLRDSDGTGVPVVATAFRPVDPVQLAMNPFRIFTSMLTIDDQRFFDAETQSRLTRFIESRQLFPPELVALADHIAAEQGATGSEAERLLDMAADAFRLSRDAIDRAWYDHLAAISSVAADIGGTASTHINHLTPRVLDIDELSRRMQARGIEMLDTIQGPPAWSGPDVLLRQTSFKALAERRWFRDSSGRVEPGELRVRFGEVEQRGIALTSTGLRLYERATAVIDRSAGELDAGARQTLAQETWAEKFPRTELELALQGVGWFTFELADCTSAQSDSRLSEFLLSRAVVPQPIVYEDFLPRSAAGIFRSNLTSQGSRDDTLGGSHYDMDRLAGILSTMIHDPQDLYRAQCDRSLNLLSQRLGRTIENDIDALAAADQAPLSPSRLLTTEGEYPL